MRHLLLIPLMVACTAPAPVQSLPTDTTPEPTDVPAPTDEPTPELGDAPDFEILVQDGSTFTLSSRAGDVILIDLSGFT